MTGGSEREYVLGTGDVEIRRLGIQHAAWRELAEAAWTRAGIGPGHTVADLGCGPGYATLDLARRVGPAGRILAIDRSRRFLGHLRARASDLGLTQIDCLERDLDTDPLPERCADHVWSRWVFSFVGQPRALLARAEGLLRAGGTLVLHEYTDYSTFAAHPRSPEIETFVAAVIASIRADGGEPDVVNRIVRWLHDDGFGDVATRPIARRLFPGQPGWDWLRSFLESHPARLVQLGRLDAAAPGRILAAVEALEARSGAFLTAPTVLEVIARR